MYIICLTLKVKSLVNYIIFSQAAMKKFYWNKAWFKIDLFPALYNVSQNRFSGFCTDPHNIFVAFRSGVIKLIYTDMTG